VSALLCGRGEPWAAVAIRPAGWAGQLRRAGGLRAGHGGDAEAWSYSTRTSASKVQLSTVAQMGFMLLGGGACCASAVHLGTRCKEAHAFCQPLPWCGKRGFRSSRRPMSATPAAYETACRGSDGAGGSGCAGRRKWPFSGGCLCWRLAWAPAGYCPAQDARTVCLQAASGVMVLGRAGAGAGPAAAGH
jgi:hypothetical protein